MKAYGLKHWTICKGFRTAAEAHEYAAKNPIEVHDRAGVHTEHYEVVEIEVPELVDCKVCGSLVTAKDPVKFPYCKDCFYVGNAHEDMMSTVIAEFEAGVERHKASVWHTGGGCFMFTLQHVDAVGVEDAEYYGLCTDEAAVEPGEDWMWIGRMRDTESGTQYAEIFDAGADNPDAKITTEQAIAKIIEDINDPKQFEEVW